MKRRFVIPENEQGGGGNLMTLVVGRGRDPKREWKRRGRDECCIVLGLRLYGTTATEGMRRSANLNLEIRVRRELRRFDPCGAVDLCK